MSSRYCPAQHQSVRKFQCLSITKITKIQGRGIVCSCLSLLLNINLC